jgi:hypothetical protein
VDRYFNNSSWKILLIPCALHMFRMMTTIDIMLAKLPLYNGMEAWTADVGLLKID